MCAHIGQIRRPQKVDCDSSIRRSLLSGDTFEEPEPFSQRSTTMKSLVENFLPSRLLLQQGIYLQTCAHIELVAWRLVQMVNGVDVNSTADIEKYLKLKLQTRQIVDQLKEAALRCPAPIGLRMLLLARRLNEGLMSRNMVAHGAWRLHSTGRLEVEHYYRGADKTFRYVSQRFGARQIEAAVEDADLLLREAVDLHDYFRSDNRRYLQFITPELDTSAKPSNHLRSCHSQTRTRPNQGSIERLSKPSQQLRASTAFTALIIATANTSLS